MTKSEYPQGHGAPLDPSQQPQAPAVPGHQAVPQPPQPLPLPVTEYAPPVAPVPVQPQAAVPPQPHVLQPQVLQPPVPQPQATAPVTHVAPPVPGQAAYPVPGQAAYGEQVPLQAQPVAPVAEQYLPPVEVPVDDYQYPQAQTMGQSILPEVPAVAVPPSMNMPGEPMMQPPHNQTAEGGYVEPAVPGGAGEQISQRLAQLQSQYDDELSGNVQNAVEAAPQFAQQISDPAPVYHAPVEEMSAYEPPLAAEPHQDQFAQPMAPATHQYNLEPPMSHEYEPAPIAAPSMGAEMGHSYAHEDHMQTQAGDFSPGIAQEPSAGKSGLKKLALGGAFVAALAVGGGAAYTYKFTEMFGNQTDSGSAPTIKAGVSPIKIVKSKLASADNSINKAVHNRLGGGASRSISVSGLTENIVRKTTSAAGSVTAASSGMMPNSDSKARSISIGGNGPRRVKTLIVRPDGTIMQPAGSDTVKSAASSGIIAETLSKTGESANEPVNQIKRMKTIGQSDNARHLGQRAAKNAPRARIVSLQPQAMRKIRAQAPIAVRPALSRHSGDVGEPFVVQVTSRTSQTGALAAFADMQQKYPSLIGEFAPDIQRADLGSKGVWYRLRVGPVSGKTAAADLCTNLKQAGHPGCFVRRK